MRNAFVSLVACGVLAACGQGATDSASSSEVATSVVSGALNNTSGSAIGWNLVPTKEHRTPVEQLLHFLDPIGTAFAAKWSCSGGTLSPTFLGKGPAGNPYTFTPVSCSVSWGSGKTASVTWSGGFTLEYGASCDSDHPWIEHQVGGCSLTRTTAVGGNTRTLTGPDGNMWSVDHDTHGAGTGWDPSVSPAPSDGGVVRTCASGGCTAGSTLIINGSHLVASVTTPAGKTDVRWNHTVSTGAGGLAVTGTGTGRVVSGTVIVEHNLAKFTATTTFDGVGFGDATCCFPTTGSVTTAFTKGADVGKTEKVEFSGASCGEATFTATTGETTPLTLQHCL